jgi:hypothetical protein
MHHGVSEMEKWEFGRNLAASSAEKEWDDLCGKPVDFRRFEPLNGLGWERNSSRSSRHGIGPVCRSEWLKSPTAEQKVRLQSKLEQKIPDKNRRTSGDCHFPVGPVTARSPITHPAVADLKNVAPGQICKNGHSHSTRHLDEQSRSRPPAK